MDDPIILPESEEPRSKDQVDLLVASILGAHAVDFREIPSDGYKFQDLITHVFNVSKDALGVERYDPSGKGPDGGVDGRLYVWGNRHFSSIPEKWLVQCKHNAHSGRAVSLPDLGASMVDLCMTERACGFLVVTSTTAAVSLKNAIDKFNDSGPIRPQSKF